VADNTSGARFEDLLGRLEGLVRALESEELDLEASLAAYEDGVRLARECHARLDDADRRVEVLRRSPSGEVMSEPLDPGTEG
jgi:exodeoxyribonuclease VII small subunit